MSLKDTINTDLKTAMKAKDVVRTSVLRMLLSEMKYAAAAVNVHQELSDDDALKVVTTYHKRLVKSLDDYPEGDRRDAIKSEITIVDGYLPKKAGPEETIHAIDAVLAATEERMFGPLMKEVLTRLGGAGDGKLVSQLLKDKLASS